jgi:hypothetical protein
MLESINKMIQIYTKKHIFPPQKIRLCFFGGWNIDKLKFVRIK